MATNNMSKATTTTSTVEDFEVDNHPLDSTSVVGETFVYFSEAPENFGYYFDIPEIYSAINGMAIWAVGKGYDTLGNTELKVELENIRGLGKDTFRTIMFNHLVTKLVVGDAFAEIVRSDNGTLLNILPISPERVRVVIENNQIKRYDVHDGKEWRKLAKENMLHSHNNRIGDQIHGTSQINAVKFALEFRNEVLRDERMIKHRELAMGILYIDSSNETKRNEIMTQYAAAVKKGEVLVLPKDTAELKDTNISPQDRLGLLQYLDNFLYQTIGIPRSMVSSDGTSEVGGKMGHVIFEPVYTKHQADLEAELWQQVAIKIKFNRPPSLGGLMQETEQKNTGQINIQPNDVTANMERE